MLLVERMTNSVQKGTLEGNLPRMRRHSARREGKGQAILTDGLACLRAERERKPPSTRYKPLSDFIDSQAGLGRSLGLKCDSFHLPWPILPWDSAQPGCNPLEFFCLFVV